MLRFSPSIEEKKYVSDCYEQIGVHQLHMLVYDLGMPHTATLLDFGCGSISAGRFLQEYLFEEGVYNGFDPNLPMGLRDRPEFVMDLSDLNRTYDYILAHSIITHAGYLKAVEIMGQWSHLLHDDGMVAFTYISDRISKEDDQWHYPRVVGQTLAAMEKAASLNGFNLTLRDDIKNPLGGGHTWATLHKMK